jgi:hypothetical protein
MTPTHFVVVPFYSAEDAARFLNTTSACLTNYARLYSVRDQTAELKTAKRKKPR